MADAPATAQPQEAAAPPDQEPRRQSDAPSGSITFRDRYIVTMGQELNGLSTPSATAYSVDDRRDMTRQLFALVCNAGLPTRTELAAVLKGTFTRGMMSLADWGNRLLAAASTRRP